MNIKTISFWCYNFYYREHHTIVDEYYRVYPYLCAAVKNFVKDQVDAEVCFLQGVFFNWPSPEFAKCWPVSN